MPMTNTLPYSTICILTMKLFIWTVKHFDQPGAADGLASKLTGSYSSGTHSLTSAKTGLQNSFPPRLRSACLSSDGLVNLSMSAVLCQGINISQKFDYIAFLGKLKIFSRTLELKHRQFFLLTKNICRKPVFTHTY